MDKDYGASGYADEKEFKKMIKELNCDFDKSKGICRRCVNLILKFYLVRGLKIIIKKLNNNNLNLLKNNK